jgi:hypothetical protein
MQLLVAAGVQAAQVVLLQALLSPVAGRLAVLVLFLHYLALQ